MRGISAFSGSFPPGRAVGGRIAFRNPVPGAARAGGIALLLGASFVVFMVVGEVFCGLVCPSPLQGVDVFGRRLRVWQGPMVQLRNGEHAYPDFKPSSEGWHRLLDDYDYRWTIDEFGLRSDGLSRKTRAVLRILTLGDSQTFGQGLAGREAFPGLLQEDLDGVAVMNGGVPGYGTFEELWKLERLAALVRPGMVLVVVHVDNALVPDEGNDLWNNYARMSAGASSPVVSQSGAPAATARFLARHSHLYGLLAETRRRFRGVPSHVQQVGAFGTNSAAVEALGRVWSRTRELLRSIADVAARASGAQTVIVYLPGVASLELEDRSALAELQKAHLRVVSLFEALQQARAGRSDRLCYAHDGHYNGFAHRVIAQALREALADSMAALVGGSRPGN